DADVTQGPDDVSEAPAPEEAKDTADGQAVSDETPTDAPTTQDATAPDEAAATDKPNDIEITQDEDATDTQSEEGKTQEATQEDQNALKPSSQKRFDIKKSPVRDCKYAQSRSIS
ncbi:MAG: hypothetical protein OIF54_18940, partial [Cohaesibacter sp.]|nr:hypothetical protein [Cohaesibacter sp.]